MTTKELKIIDERAKKATSGPWSGRIRFHYDEYDSLHDIFSREDAEFIIHAREDIPSLLTHIREVQEDLAIARSEIIKLNRALKRYTLGVQE